MRRKAVTPPHHRMTVADVVRDFKAGLLTPKGALFYAVSAQRKQGQTVRLHPDTFCTQFGIHRATFYRKLSELVVEHRIEFSAEGILELKIPIADSTGIPDYIVLEELSQPCDKKSQPCDELSQPCDKKSQPCDELSQPCDKKSLDSLTDGDSKSPQSYLSIQSLSKEERETDIDPEFRRFLINRANLLPKPPALLEQWVYRQSKIKANQREFEAERESRERASVPPPTAAPIFLDSEGENQQRLALLQHWWDDGAQVRVEATIAAHPEWGLTIGQFGPEVADG